MGREVSKKAAVLVILLFVGLIAVWAHFNAKSLAVDAPSFIKQNPKGHIVVRLGDKFYETTIDGIDIQQFYAQDANLDKVIGDFDFFNNGDILIYNTSYTPDFLDNLKTFARIEEDRNRPEKYGEGFYRCHFSMAECSLFSKELPSFNRTFRLTIDDNDNVYIVDTTRHRILKVNSSGELIATLDEGLKFPNDILWEEDVLWLVNTNHHEILSLEAKTEGFGKRLNGFSPRIPGRNFPADFARVDSDWFAISMDNSMVNGKLGKFNASGELVEVIDFGQDKADLAFVTRADNHLIASDTKHLRYRVINIQDLKIENDFSSNAIDVHLSQSKSIVSENNKLSWLIVAIGVLAFLVLAYFAVKSEVAAIESDIQRYDDDSELEADMPEGVQEYWISESKQYSMVKGSIRWLVPLGVIVVIIALMTSKVSLTLLIFALMGLAAFYSVWRMYRHLRNVGIGISGQSVIIRNNSGTTSFGKGNEIYVSSSALCIDDVIVPIKIFDIDEMERWIKPRLKYANRLSETQMMAKQWKLRHPILMEPLKLCVVMLIATILMEVLR